MDLDDVVRSSDELNEPGLDVVDSTIQASTYLQPFDHFGEHVADE